MRFKFPGLCFLLLIGSLAIADTDIEFSGTLIAEPCLVSTDSEDQTVEFGTVVNKIFINHTRSVPESFSIKLLECDLTVGNNVTVTFSGTEDGLQSDTFAVTGAAEGIAIAIENENSTPVIPEEAMKPVPLSGETTILNYRAYVQANDYSKVKEGDFQSVVSFLLEYD